MFLGIPRILYRRLMLVYLLSLMLILNGCTTLILEPYVGKRADQYKNYKIKNGLALATKPVIDSTESEKYFGVDLLSRKILPVFIVVENKSVSSSFTILKKSIKLIDENTLFNHAADNDAGKEKAEGGAAVALTGAVLIALPLLFAGMKMVSDATVIKHSISSQEFQIRTLSPGEKASGFLYFQIPDIKDNVNLILKMDAINPMTQDIVAFNNNVHLKFNNKINIREDELPPVSG